MGCLGTVTTQRPDLDTLRARADALWGALPPEVMELARAFDGAGHEFALVGGPVRDAFLARSSADFDFATSARPDDTERLLAAWGGKTWDMGREYGTIGVMRGTFQVEVTTYRADEYDGATRKPSVTFGDSLDGD